MSLFSILGTSLTTIRTTMVAYIPATISMLTNLTTTCTVRAQISTITSVLAATTIACTITTILSATTSVGIGAISISTAYTGTSIAGSIICSITRIIMFGSTSTSMASNFG